ncbi:hypothetical protein [Aminipila terrae]|uniref:Uncharacterized protein n=1 Tax=Aminipila terrae TaxID=2697030 RepID=A0A6P1MLA4_9FIRM|nr:hypothetical protein [Aminipila terrae]QHI71755.1 hypothetical protein Ami3637_04565 [Aminipila terrae]
MVLNSYRGQIIKISELLPAPSQLYAMEANAVELMNDLYAGDWQKSEEHLELIKSNMNEVIPLLNDASVLVGLIARMNLEISYLDQYVTQKETQQAIEQANRITIYTTQLLDYFKTDFPTDLNRFGYLARQIIIDAENNDWSEANNMYLILKKTWDKLKLLLNSQYQNDFNLIINSLGESIQSKDYQSTIKNANTLLDKTEELKAVFIQQNNM